MAEPSLNGDERKERRRQYRAANRDRINAQKRAWAAANKDKISEYDRQYRAANADKIREQKARGYQANREEERAKRRGYYAANRDAVLATVKSYADANRPQIQEYKRRYYRANGTQVRQKILERAHGADIAAEWAAMWNAQEGRCYLCGREMVPEDAHVEHWHGCPAHSPKKSCRHCRRGLAHQNCNLVVGHAADDPDLLRVIAYNLEQANAQVQVRQRDMPQQSRLL